MLASPPVEILRLAPKIERAGRSLRRDRVEIPGRDRPAAVAFARTGAGLGGADFDAHEARRREDRVHPAVDPRIRREIGEQPEIGRYRRIQYPAVDPDRVALDPVFDRNVVFRDRRIGQWSCGAAPGDGSGPSGSRSPAWRCRRPCRVSPRQFQSGWSMTPKSGMRPLVGQRRIARPDPDPVVFFGNRIAAHPRRRRDMRLARDMDAGAVGRESQAVIGAFDGIAANPAAGELGVAVAAAVLQRNRCTVRHPVQHDRLAEHKAAHRVQPPDLVIPGGDVPAVLRKHFARFLALPRAHGAESAGRSAKSTTRPQVHVPELARSCVCREVTAHSDRRAGRRTSRTGGVGLRIRPEPEFYPGRPVLQSHCRTCTSARSSALA